MMSQPVRTYEYTRGAKQSTVKLIFGHSCMGTFSHVNRTKVKQVIEFWMDGKTITYIDKWWTTQ